MNRERYVKNRTLVRLIKSDPCLDCHRKFPAEAMHFDHLENKRFNVGQYGARSIREILKEIAKCDVVCANCHAIRTYRRYAAKKAKR